MKPEPPRSSHWPAARRQWLNSNPTCANCGGRANAEVHHTLPVHVRPDLELDPRNYVTLCEGPAMCHLHYGHLGDWHDYNPALVNPILIAPAPPAG